MITNIDDLMNELNKYFKAYVAEFAQNKEQLVSLRDGHKTIRCLFPDHVDQNPSMLLNDHSAHCFKCGTMNIFKAANIFEGKPLSGEGFIKENVFYLAEKFNIAFKNSNSENLAEIEEKLKIVKFFELMKEFILRNIDSQETSYFLEQRSIGKDIARAMGIGYLDFEKFNIELKKKGLEPTDYIDYGYTTNNFTKTKLAFIIEDENNKPISFAVREMHYSEQTARAVLKNYLPEEVVNKTSKGKLVDLVIEATTNGMSNDEADFISKSASIAKYINGNDNLYYKKKEILYGLNVAKKYKKNFSSIYLVEGYIDVLSAYRNKNYTTVAYCSGDISDKQIEKLRKLGFDKIVFVPDTDETGMKKIEKMIEKSKKERIGFEIGTIKNLESIDPKDIDELLTELNQKGIKDVKMQDILEIKPIIKIEAQILKSKGVEGIKFINDLSTSASVYENPAEREFLLRALDKDISKEDLQLIKETASFLIKYKQDELAKDIEKEGKEFLKLIRENPLSIGELCMKFKNDMETKFQGRIAKKLSYKESSLEQSKKCEEDKKEQKSKNVFGWTPLDDLDLTEPVMITLVGKSNTGKTQKMINAALNKLLYDENSAVVYLSEDDVFAKIKNRMIANLALLNVGFASNPFYHEKLGVFSGNLDVKTRMSFKKSYEDAVNTIDNWIIEDRLLLFGSNSKVNTVYQLEEVLKEHTKNDKIKTANKLLFIDPASKLVIPGENDLNRAVALTSNFIKNTIIPHYEYSVVANFELTKEGLKKQRFVKIEDLAGSKSVQYDSDVIFLVVQTLHDLQEKSTMVWLNEYKQPQPVVTIINEKDKVSDKKGEIYYYKLDGQKAKMMEIRKGDDIYEEMKNSFMNDKRKYTE